MRSFLLSHPVTLTPPEALDIQRRLEADAVREEGRKRFKEEAERRVEALRVGLAQFKGDVLSREGGLKSVFDVVRRVEKVEDLPPAEKSVLEWGRISLAATIFQTYVASDTASESLASLKRLHGMTPYFILKGILKISNPMAMIRGELQTAPNSADSRCARPLPCASVWRPESSPAVGSVPDVSLTQQHVLDLAL